MAYAEQLEKDGHFGETARQAWADANDDWHAFGMRLIPCTLGFSVRLLDGNGYETRKKEIEKDLPGMNYVFISSITGKGISLLKDKIWYLLHQ